MDDIFEWPVPLNDNLPLRPGYIRLHCELYRPAAIDGVDFTDWQQMRRANCTNATSFALGGMAHR
jgi:hypothetical protein